MQSSSHLGRSLAEAQLNHAGLVQRRCQAVEIPIEPFAHLQPLIEIGAAELAGHVGEVFQDRRRLAQMAAVVAVDQKGHLAVALPGEMGRLLVLARHHVHVHVVEGLAHAATG